MSQETSLLPKDKGPTTDPGKAAGIKRLQSDASSGPGFHNVYVRRKVESEHSKVNPSQELKTSARDKTKELEAQQDVPHEEASKPLVASPVAESVQVVSTESPEKSNEEIVPEKTEPPESVQVVSIESPEKSNEEIVPEKTEPPESVQVVSIESPEKSNEEIVPEKTEPPVVSGTSGQDNVKDSSIQYWNERFNRLQTYLENCDRSSQEDYLRKLRCLSAAGRSMHAVELEKRAMHLLVEEGKELQRMKALNVLGKVSPNTLSKHTILQRQPQK